MILKLNADQLAELVQRHRPVVRRTLRRYTSSGEELADWEQETFMRALVSLPELRHPEGFLPWVISIARNLALNALRGAGRERDRMRLFAIEAERVAEIEMAETGLIEIALSRLPEERAHMLRLFYFEGMAGRDIARHLHLSEAAVRQRLTRSRNQLKETVMDIVRKDEDLAEVLVERLLNTARSLSEKGKYQAAVEKFMEAFDEFPDLTAFNRLPTEIRKAMSDAWGETFRYLPPETIEEPEGMEFEEYDEILQKLAWEERGDLNGTIEDIARRLQVSPAWVYWWWKQGMTHWKHKGSGTVRFTIGQVRMWLKENKIEMPPKVSGADSYFLTKGIARGLEEGLLTADDVDFAIEVFERREHNWLFKEGSFSSLKQVGSGCPEEGREALARGAALLTDLHQKAVALRRNWTPNDGFSGAWPYDGETGMQIAADLREMKEQMQQAEEVLEKAAITLEQIR